MFPREHLILLPQNRVWRTYPGGATLEKLAGLPQPQDSHLAEDWIGSITRSTVPGREAHDEGVSPVVLGGKTYDFKELVTAEPAYFLGPRHVEKYGPSLMLLVKFLDSAIRLNFQCHPSRDFAQRVLGSPSGKTEAYHVLAVREGVTTPYVYLGFQNPPSAAQLKEWILTQNIPALEGCFEKIPLKVGDTILIPGGLPHALGEGVFMVEIQEPTDFAVRYEFERAGYVLPEAARFMNRGIDFGLSMIESRRVPREEIEANFRSHPRLRRSLGPRSQQYELIGPAMTPCFEVWKSHLREKVTKTEERFHIGIVTRGEVRVTLGRDTHTLRTFEKFFCPAGQPLTYEPLGEADVLECLPPL